MPSVVHIIARMNVGGPAALITRLLDGLPGQLLLTGEVQSGEADYLDLRAPETPYTRVPGLGRGVQPSDDLRAMRFLVDQLKRLRPKVVHTHTAKAGVLGRVAARYVGVPSVVHTFHGHLLHGYFSPLSTRGVVVTERVLARRTDRIVAVGDRVRQDLLAAGIGRPDQYDVIPPGIAVNSPPDRLTARASLGLPPHAKVAATVGRLIAIKRPDRLMDVARRAPEFTFLVAGEGPLLASTKAQAPRNVRFLGWRSDVETVHAAADVALLTSDNEGMPVSLIEAALCGIPAVSTDVGSAREVVTGEVVTPDAGAIAEALRRVVAQDLGQSARRLAEERFGVPGMLAAHRRLYEQL